MGSAPMDTIKRVVKKKRGHAGHHGGAWKVAYADFVTAMMALFIVLWIVGQSKTVKEAVAAYFRDPSVLQKGASGVLTGSTGPGGNITPPASVAGQAKDGRGGEGQTDRAALEATAAALREKIHREANLVKLEDKIKIDLAENGLRIQLVETGQGLFFDVGSAAVKASTRDLLAVIAKDVGQLPNEVAVEGHTDSRPYVGVPNYTNWELSADRANAARRILEANGLRPNQIVQVVGFADRRLADPANPLDAANRRISIIVRFRGEHQTGPPPPASPSILPPGSR
jgi:chemotaxis protein MotB